MSDTVKLIIEIPKEEYNKIREESIFLNYVIMANAIKNGTPLDSNSELAEMQAYFAGMEYGWEKGRESLIDDVKSEFRISYPANYMGEPELNGTACHFSLNKVLEILDNIGEGDKE